MLEEAAIDIGRPDLEAIAPDRPAIRKDYGPIEK